MKYGVAYNAWVKPVNDDIYDEVGAAEHEDCAVAFLSDDVQKLIDKVQEDDDYLLVFGHKFEGGDINDIGGKVTHVFISRDDAEFDDDDPREQRPIAVIFDNPSEVEVI